MVNSQKLMVISPEASGLVGGFKLMIDIENNKD